MRLDQGLLHRWIAKRGPLLKQLNSEPGGQWIGRPAALLALLWGQEVRSMRSTPAGAPAPPSQRGTSPVWSVF